MKSSDDFAVHGPGGVDTYATKEQSFSCEIKVKESARVSGGYDVYGKAATVLSGVPLAKGRCNDEVTLSE
jgi:hypothetical protein